MGKPAVPFAVHPILHPGGARSYVVVDPDSRDALVVDPVLELTGDVLRVLSAERATLRWVVDTHSHGDHLSGAARLREKTGAEVVLSSVADSKVATRRMGEGDVLALGEAGLTVRAAPGVSPDAIVLQGPGVLFTGDTVLVGTIGVRDAPGADGAALYDTIQRIVDPLPDETVIHPGHDDMGRWRTTVKAEKRGNRWVREKDRDAFLARWDTDPRSVPKAAPGMLAANRDGALETVPDLEAVPVVGQPAKGAGPVVAPQGMKTTTGQPAPGRGMADLALAGGAVCVLGCAAGFALHPLFHLAGGVVGAFALGAGVVAQARKPRPAQAPGLYYTGPQKRTPLR